MVGFVPFLWNIRGNSPDCFNVDLFCPGQSWLERIPTCDVSVDPVPSVHAAQWRIGEAPFAGIKQ
jgi:hypothetical protein